MASEPLASQMFGSGKAGSTQGRRSLLSFSRGAGDAGAEETAALSVGHESKLDAQTRHRLARARREARRSPLLDALANSEEPQDEGEPVAAVPAATKAVAEPPRRDPIAEEHVNPADTHRAAESQATRSAGIGGRLKGFARGWLDRDDRIESVSAKPADAHYAEADMPAPSNAYRGERYAEEPRDRDVASEVWTPLIDPLRVIGRVFDSKLLILATTALGLVIGVAVALQASKKYEAITELLVDPRDLKLSERDLTQQGLPSDATLAIVENQARVLTSGTVLAKVVERLNLASDPEFNGERKSFGVGAFISELRSILSRGGSRGDGTDYRHTLAVENLARALTVERGGKTFVITIGASTENPEKSALIANTMTEVFLQTYGQIQSQAAGRATEELTARLDELRKGVEQAERAVATFKAENDIIDPQGRLITDDEIVKLNDQLSTARARTLELTAKAASVRDVDVNSIVTGGIPESVNSNIITELRSQYAALKNEADRVAVRLGPRHPERQALDAQLSGAREQIATELRRLASSIQVELKRAVQLEQQLAQRLAQLKVRQGDLSGGLVQLRELEREATTKRAVYEAYLLRARETGEQSTINTANMSVISTAYPPLDPSGPSRSTIALTGLLLGFASGVGLAMMRGAYDSLRDSRRNAQGRRSRSMGPRPNPDGNGPGSPNRGSRDQNPPAAAARSDVSISAAPNVAATRAFAEDPDATSLNTPDTPFPDTPSNEDSAMLNRPMDPYYPYASEPAGHQRPDHAPVYANPMPPQNYPPQPVAYPQPYSGYVQPAYPQAPMHPAGYAPMHPGHAYAPQPDPRMQPAHWQGYGAPAQMPTSQMPIYGNAPMAYQPAPAAYPQPAPSAGPRHAAEPIPFPVRSVQAVDASPPSNRTLTEQETSSAIADIRASLAEFREAVRDFSESRQRRRFF